MCTFVSSSVLRLQLPVEIIRFLFTADFDFWLPQIVFVSVQLRTSRLARIRKCSTMLFPADGSTDDVRRWMFDCPSRNLPSPVDLERLESDLHDVDIEPQFLINCPVNVATQKIRNWRYAAYCIVLLPRTPQNVQNKKDPGGLFEKGVMVGNLDQHSISVFSSSPPAFRPSVSSSGLRRRVKRSKPQSFLPGPCPKRSSKFP